MLAGPALGLKTGPPSPEQLSQDAPARQDAELIDRSVGTLRKAVFEELLVTAIIILVFLAHVRSTFVAVLVMNLLAFRRDSIAPKHLIEGFEANLNEKKFQEAFDLAKNDDSMLGHMLSAGMAKLQQGYDKALEAVGEVPVVAVRAHRYARGGPECTGFTP